ncbi:MAG: Cobyric acid synthase [Candidatus Tokpelaia sp. JSC189]|nr:MAG: Cobyric acid synthase [Candidatus Tokpelaia sp. JSC189]
MAQHHQDGRIWDTYLHGIFSAGVFRRKFLQILGGFSDGRGYDEKIDKALDSIAETLEKTIDVNAIFYRFCFDSKSATACKG